VLTKDEAAAFAEEQRKRQDRDLIDPEKGGALYPPESEGGVVPYNEFWYDRGTDVTNRTSLIIDPADGRIPQRTPAAQRKLKEDAAASRADQAGRPRADHPEERNLGERCVTRVLPRLPGAYNNNYEIVQAPGFVAIRQEMNNEVRIVPLDGRPHVPNQVRLWQGDSRGRWEGSTLVVETTNFSDKTSFQGASANLHLVERFTRVDADTIEYQFTVTDPAAWVRPWSASYPLTLTGDQVYEYACHEGNYGLIGQLSGARADDKARAAAARSGTTTSR
jgi:hypothetical protein